MRIILCGYSGRMGQAVTKLCEGSDDIIVAGIDQRQARAEFPTYTSFSQCLEKADVVIDFSNHLATEAVIGFALSNSYPVVIATTGQSEEEQRMIDRASEKIPVFQSSNLSIGVSLLTKLCKESAAVVGTFSDIEIVEKHHNQKLDAPSGTALSIAHDIQKALDHDTQLIFDRTGRRQKRQQEEIGISSVRAGNIVGEHEILFCWGDEIISLKHTALSRSIFAEGALRAAGFILSKNPGLYNMNDLISGAHHED